MGWIDAIASTANTITNIGASFGGAALNNYYQKKAQERAYEYGEKAADNAARRQKEFYDYTFDKNTPAAYRKLLEDAGLSVGLMYGMQGGGGVSADSGSAPQGQGTGSIPNPLTEKLYDPLVAAQIENIKADTQEKKANAGEITANTATINAIRDYLVENSRLEAAKKWFENIESKIKWDKDFLKMITGKNENPTAWSFYNKTLKESVEVDGETINGMQLMNDATQAYWNAQGAELSYEMQEAKTNIEKQENQNWFNRYTMEMSIMQQQKAKIQQEIKEIKENTEVAKAKKKEIEALEKEHDAIVSAQEATAKHIAWSMGDYNNWKTYFEIGSNIASGLIDVAGTTTRGIAAIKAAKNVKGITINNNVKK